MRKLSAAAPAVFAVLLTACGGSPTSPQPAARAGTSAADVGNAPVPGPPAPEPAPAPPAPPAPAPPDPAPPAPAPAPDPAPPVPVETWHATVEVQRAADPKDALPETFTVTIRGTQMMFGPLEVTILARDGNHIYARKGQDITIEIDDGKFTVTSVPVFATGMISYSAP